MTESLMNNEKLARVRLGLSKRLGQNPDLARRYDVVLQEMENEHFIEEVPLQERASVLQASTPSGGKNPVSPQKSDLCLMHRLPVVMLFR